MNTTSTTEFDVIVIGGGPGGSTAAAFIAMQGHRVLLLERETFPRYQIGESLLPVTIHGICRLLGVQERVAAAHFTRKRGGTFRWGNDLKPWTFTFGKNPDAPGGFAYQVERAKFDKILLDNCREKGVDVREAHRVEEILFHDGRAIGVNFCNGTGERMSARSRYIVDAGGARARQYNPHVGERIFSKFFQNIALYGYFENCARLPPPNQGNIFCCAFEDGWFWYIPLSESLTSVGAVVSRQAAKWLQNGHEEALGHFVGRCPAIKELLLNARRVTQGMYGELRVRKDYSYCNSKFWTPGLALIGDAACFIDPVFSSGVHLSTYAALLVARSINTSLRGNIPEDTSFNEFEGRYLREFANFYQFLLAFYDMHQDQESYFWTARKILNTDESANDAFVRLISGRSSPDEPVVAAGDYFRSRAGIGVRFAEMVTAAEESVMGASPRAAAGMNRQDPTAFMSGLVTEITQVQLQALFGNERPREFPIIGKLVPSSGGFHWARART